MKKITFLLLLALVAVSLPLHVQANDYLEVQRHYQVYSNGRNSIHFKIPVWAHGNWNDYHLDSANLAVTIANRGWYYVPHIHKDTKNQRYLTKRQTKVAKEAYAPVIEGMRLAVEQGTATSIKTTYPICGKTGTIENPGEDHSAFIAFAPMNNPKIAIAVYVEHGGFGADLAAPMAGLLIEAYLKGKLSQASEEKAKRIERKKI